MKKELPKTWWGNLKYPCLHGVLHFAVAMRHLPGQSFLCTQGCCTWFSSKSAKCIWSNNCRRFWFTFSTSESGAWRSRPWSRPHLWQEEICCIFCDEKSPFQVSLSPLRCIQNVWVRARACRFSALRPWLHLGRGMSLLKQCCCNRLLFCFGKKYFGQVNECFNALCTTDRRGFHFLFILYCMTVYTLLTCSRTSTHGKAYRPTKACNSTNTSS